MWCIRDCLSKRHTIWSTTWKQQLEKRLIPSDPIEIRWCLPYETPVLEVISTMFQAAWEKLWGSLEISPFVQDLAWLRRWKDAKLVQEIGSWCGQDFCNLDVLYNLNIDMTSPKLEDFTTTQMWALKEVLQRIWWLFSGRFKYMDIQPRFVKPSYKTFTLDPAKIKVGFVVAWTAGMAQNCSHFFCCF